jgi:hypothetical protein
MKKLSQYLFNILVSIDQFGNTLAGGAPDETISSRLGRNYRGSWFEKLVDWGAYQITGKKDHCEDALEPPECQKDAVLAMKEDKDESA